MNFVGTHDTQLTYMPFQHINLSDGRYRFRLPNDSALDELGASLTRKGQTTPIFLEQTDGESCIVLDGHNRCEAIRRIRDNGGVWEKMLAHVIPVGRLSAWDRFRLIDEKNMRGQSPYGMVERGRLFKHFIEHGLPIQGLAVETGMSAHDVEDLAELSAASAELSSIFENASLPPAYALMLHRRYDAWSKSRLGHLAPAAAAKVLAHWREERLSMKSWRFLLDFYWSGEQPFMS